MFKGTVIAQIIGVVGAIFLAKIYGSEAYGIFGAFTSTLGILSVFNTLQLDKSIVTIKSQDESKNLMNSLFISTLLVALLLIIIYSLVSTSFSIHLFEVGIITASFFASILFSFNKIHEAFFTFRKKFKPISNAKILATFFNVIFQILLFNKFELMGLIYGNIISISLITIFYFYKNRNYIAKIELKQFKNSIVSNYSIIKYIFPSTLINSLAINLMPILIVSVFSLKDSGVYFLSLKILAAPLFLISSSISLVYYQKSSEMLNHSKRQLYTLTKKIVLTNLGIMLAFILFINTLGIYFLEFFLNKSWEDLRFFTFILSFLILARTSFNPISNIIIVLNKNHVSLLFNCYLLLVNLVAIYFGYITNTLVNTLVILSLFGGFGYFALLIYFLKELKNNHD